MRRPTLSALPAGIRSITGTGTAPDTDPDDGLAAPHQQQETALQDLRDYLTASRQHLDTIARKLRDVGKPNVLETATVQIPAAGFVERSYRVPYAAVAASNLSGAQVVITTAGGQGPQPPGPGQGQLQLPPNTFLAQNMSGQTIAIYGAAGAIVVYSVLVDRIEPDAAYLGGTPPGQSASGYGNPVAPALATVVAQITGLAPGTYSVQVYTGFLGTTAAGDVDNLNLTVGGQLVTRLLYNVQGDTTPDNPPVSAQVVIPAGGAALQVVTIGAGSVGVTYRVLVVATRIL